MASASRITLGAILENINGGLLLNENKHECRSYQELADKYNLTRGQVARKIADAKERAQHQAPVFVDRKTPVTADWHELIDIARASKKIADDANDTQRIATVKIETDKPNAVVFADDWQLGDCAVDYDQWVNDITFMLESPNLYLAAMGDEIQNMRSFKSLAGVLVQVLTPPQQCILLKGIINELTDKNKLIAKVDGNHDREFDERLFGEDIQKYYLDKMKAPRFTNKGLLNLTVGSETYTLLLFHKSRFRSFLRKAHGAYREHQLSFPADVVAGAHDHDPAYEMFYHYTLAREAGKGFGGKSYLIKTGTYQDSEFGWRYFHNGGFPVTITVVFYPGEHKMQLFDNMRDAAEFMRII